MDLTTLLEGGAFFIIFGVVAPSPASRESGSSSGYGGGGGKRGLEGSQDGGGRPRRRRRRRRLRRRKRDASAHGEKLGPRTRKLHGGCMAKKMRRGTEEIALQQIDSPDRYINLNRSVFPIPVSSFRPFSFPSLFFWVAKGRRRVEEEEEEREDPPPPSTRRQGEEGCLQNAAFPHHAASSSPRQPGTVQDRRRGSLWEFWMKILSIFTHRRARRTSSSPLFCLAMRGEFFLFLSVTRKCFIWCQGGSFVLCCQSKRFLESDWGGEGEREKI